ncbi:conjugal transfer protein [Solirubrobacter ginsenosidimutans]|uniref:Conjugal transfer protein n=1 Tax=Solirubrobacter ginsenosidimutans TaxID=490573 RepID=A0A9X3MQI8_9ACTN|nr:conjugal transfer protein [Solirubrobacter ginsenosidimutans]MDA0160644.1 conjugal transfer protein [Solirubrobacter ginsenosidimutans]
MTGLRVRSRSGRSKSLTRGDFIRRLGQTVLWLLVLVLLVRGVAQMFAREPVAVVPVTRAVPAAWPDDEARAFGAAFVRAYFTASPREPGAQASALARFVSPELAESIAPEVGERSRGESVTAVTFARAARVGRRQALLTFAVAVGDGTRYVTVPVARDVRGGLVVDELPSFAAPPRVASVPESSAAPISGVERDQLGAIVERFLRAYVAGDAGGLAYMVLAGARIATPGTRAYELVELVSLAQAEPARANVRDLDATVRVRELGSGAVYSQLYRLRLERRERWYVADVNGSREG